MITGAFGDASLPANIDDYEISPNTQQSPISRQSFTDMSFSLMCALGCTAIKGFAYVANDGTASEQTWQSKQERAEDFKKTIWDLYLRHCNIQDPYHLLCINVCDIMTDSLMLTVVRPLHIDPQIKSRPQVEGSRVLALAVDVMQKHRSLNTTPSTEPWRWFIWPQWHALAIAIAELCVQTQGPLVEAAWEIVDYSFQDSSETVADSKSGMLWQPIQKLMKKAKQIRRNAQAVKNTNTSEATPNSAVQIPDASQANSMPLNAPGTRLYPAVDNSKLQNAEMGRWGSRLQGLEHTVPDAQSLSLRVSSETPASFTNATLNAFSLDISDLNDDMGWMNWESFVEGVDFSDHDFSGYPANSSNTAMETGT